MALHRSPKFEVNLCSVLMVSSVRDDLILAENLEIGDLVFNGALRDLQA